jgi:hypothetical protein
MKRRDRGRGRGKIQGGKKYEDGNKWRREELLTTRGIAVVRDSSIVVSFELLLEPWLEVIESSGIRGQCWYHGCNEWRLQRAGLGMDDVGWETKRVA